MQIVNMWGRSATAYDITQLFLLPRKNKWPDEGMPGRWIQGIYCWVEPIGPAVWGGRRPFKLRAMCKCPTCDITVAIGRLEQHIKIHK